jgi:hypothetical protein
MKISILEDCEIIDNWVAFEGAQSSSGEGGGTIGGYLYRCKVSGNSGSFGGGSYYGTLVDCTLTDNTGWFGGGAFGGYLANCTVVSNVARQHLLSPGEGGGVADADLYNCIIYYNFTDGTQPNCTDGTGATLPPFPACRLNYCCTTLAGPTQPGNITNAPLFVDLAGGDLHLQSNSPCLNAGNNQYADTFDLDWNPRIVGGTVDMGAYEYQIELDLYRSWLQQHGLPTDGSADYLDSDADGMNNWMEWCCGTIPTNALSVFKVTAPTRDALGVTVSWQSVAGRNYSVERASGVGSPLAFSIIADDLFGQQGTMAYTDTDASGPGPFFYRVTLRP